jgi:membrane protein implicated in regulation of membrane protease activity
MKTKILMGIIFPVLISLIMDILMTFVMIAINVGFSDVKAFFVAFGFSSLIGFAVALPVSLIFIPLIRNFLLRYANDSPDRKE